MTQTITPSDEWIEWNGGECPVPRDTIVEVKLRCGDVMGTSHTLTAGDWCKSEDFPDEPSQWEHVGWADDIIAYRKVNP